MSNFDKIKPPSQTPNLTAKENELWDLDQSYHEDLPSAPLLAKVKHSQNQPSGGNNTDTKTKPPIESTQAKSRASKAKLSIIEKLALTSFALMLLCGGAVGYLWLYKKNKLAEISYTLDLPVKGQYSTIKKFSSYWKDASKLNDINNNTFAVPSVSITLDKKSTSGVLRFYFSHKEEIIGDPISVNFKDGLFEDGTNSLEVYATNGVASKNNLLAYQLEPHINWQVSILEAKNRNVKGSEFKLLARTNISKHSEPSEE